MHFCQKKSLNIPIRRGMYDIAFSQSGKMSVTRELVSFSHPPSYRRNKKSGATSHFQKYRSAIWVESDSKEITYLFLHL